MAKKSESEKNVGKRIKIRLPNKRLSKRTILLTVVVVVAVGLFGASGWLWWTRIFTDEQRVFDDMLANSLSSTAIVRRVEQKDQSSSVDQKTYVSFRAPDVMSQTVAVLGEKDANRKTTTVTTETIGTPERDLVRYVSAEGAEDLSIAGNLPDVLGVWGEQKADVSSGQPATFLNEAIFNLVPFGNLTRDQRRELLVFINEKKVYQIARSQRTFADGRYTYNYTVAINPIALVETLAKYAELTGLGDSSQLDPALYANSPPVNVILTVDILSRQLLRVGYLSNGRSETFEGRNLFREVQIPESTIPFEELQNRLTRGTNAAGTTF